MRISSEKKEKTRYLHLGCSIRMTRYQQNWNLPHHSHILAFLLHFTGRLTILERIAPKMSKSLFTEHANMLLSMAKGTLDYLVGP